MNVIAYAPWSSRDRWNREMNQLVNGLARSERRASNAWVPLADIREQEDAYLLSLDIPGVDPATVDVRVDKGVLTIAGERKSDIKVESGTVRNRERVQGTFSRRFSLPEGVDVENIQAVGKHGVLTVTIPRVPAAQTRRITVNA